MSALTDKLRGSWNEIKGKLKEEYGESTDNELILEEGKEDQMIGQLQKKMGKTKEEVKDWIDKF